MYNVYILHKKYLKYAVIVCCNLRLKRHGIIKILVAYFIIYTHEGPNQNFARLVFFLGTLIWHNLIADTVEHLEGG